MEEEKAQIAGALSDPAALAPADFTRLGARHGEIEEQVATLMNEWESVETELASLN